MILLFAAILAAPPPAHTTEAAIAIEAGRFDQARTMIGDAVASGTGGTDLELLLADLAFAEKRWGEASSRYAKLIAQGTPPTRTLERAGIAALQAGDIASAAALLRSATARADSSWRAWNALGVAADRQGEWATARHAFGRGLALSPSSPELLNNLGWSLLLQKQWAAAEPVLAQALALAPSNHRIRNNLELARLGKDQVMPSALPSEEPGDYAARLNDTGVVAMAQGDVGRAQSAFAQAMQTDSRWNARAANNLELAGGSVSSDETDQRLASGARRNVK